MDSNLLILFVGLWIGLTKGGVTGPIGGAILLPLLTQTMTVPQAAGISLPLLMFADLFAMRFYWKQWDMRYIRLMMPMAIVGILMGTFLLANLPDITLRRILGFMTLALIVYKLASDTIKRIQYTPRDEYGYLAGWTSGFASALANVGGPPISAYLLLEKAPPKVYVGTVTLFFFVVNILKVPGYLLNGIIDIPQLLKIIWILPLIPFGVWVGRRIIGWVNPILFERVMMVLLFIAALTLLINR